jgi:hypothetical protein
MPILGVIASSTRQGQVVSDTGAMFPIFSTTLTSATSSITFSNIPQTYTHLQLFYTTRANQNDNMVCRFNSDSGNNYDTHFTYSNSSPTTGAGAEIGVSRFYVDVNSISSDAFTIGTMDILDYRNTNKYKVARTLATLSINQNSTPSAYNWIASGLWRNTNAITSINVFANASAIYQIGSTFELYGIKGA